MQFFIVDNRPVDQPIPAVIAQEINVNWEKWVSRNNFNYITFVCIRLLYANVVF